MSSDDDGFPATPTTSGWYPLNDGSDQETYWDGTAWTKRRQYRFGSPFLEIPLHRSDPPLAPAPIAPTSSIPAPTSLVPAPPVSASSGLRRSGPSVESMYRNLSEPSPAQPTAPSPRYRSTRQRIRIIQLIYAVAIIGFFVAASGWRSSSSNPDKYFVYLFVIGIAVHLIVRMASLGARRDVRDQESGRRPSFPFRYLSRLTDGLQGPRLTSFIGGMRTQPRLSPTGFNATVPMVRLSVFSNGVRVGPSSPVLSMSVPTWEARFDELDVIQFIGRVRGLTTGILLRKSQSHEWVIFWTTNRERVFTELEQMGVAVSREPVHLRTGSQWRVNQFVEDELRSTEPSVLASANAAPAVPAGPPFATAPLVFAAPLNRSTTAPEDKKWPGIVVNVVVVLVILSSFVLIFRVVHGTNLASPSTSNDGGVTTTLSTPVSEVTVSPPVWRNDAVDDADSMRPELAGIPDLIRNIRYDYGVTDNSFFRSDLVNELSTMRLNCEMLHGLSEFAPSPVLAHDAQNASVACGDLIRYDQLDLTKSHQRWTPTLASNDAHWLKILKERVAVLKNAATT